MNTDALVELLNTGTTANDMATAKAVLMGMTLRQIAEVDRHPDLIVHAYGGPKGDKIDRLIAGIRREMSYQAIQRNGGGRN
jgi:hypothetical protein